MSSPLLLKGSGETGKSSNKCSGSVSSQMKPSSVNVSFRPDDPKRVCHYCKDGRHAIAMCDSFAGIPFADRVSFLKINGLCFGCLRHGHFKYDWHNRLRCSKYKGVHPTVMHIISKIGSQNEDVCDGSSSQSIPVGQLDCHMGAGDVSGTLAIIPVNIRSANGMKVVSTYAFLDPGFIFFFLQKI